ncbi:MAG TPA: hypothetical protein PKA31_03565 [Candidatus Moranbacteria bacterium]|nr:hypothetical protein [Candidatus Moranbacteria bacterium]
MATERTEIDYQKILALAQETAEIIKNGNLDFWETTKQAIKAHRLDSPRVDAATVLRTEVANLL